MAKYCANCGAAVAEGVAFCPSCGKATSNVGGTGAAPGAQAGMQENVAGLLSYVVGWITGLIFFLIDKRPFVRFHAMQSIITFGAFNVLQWILVWSGWFGGIVGWALLGILGTVLWLLMLVCWILCMVKAYQGQRFKLPVVGDLAENFSK